jgi:hypothetical protein
MQVKIYIKEESLEELSAFLKASVLYEHSINFLPYKDTLSGGVEVSIFYDDYVKLKDWKMKDKNDPLS